MIVNYCVFRTPHACRHGFIVLVGFLLLAVITLLARTTAEAQSPPPAEDTALMARLQEQVMALPEESREEQGVKILLENVAEFKGEVTRRRVHLSIAELLAKLGDTEQSLVHFEKAGVSKSQETASSGFDAISRGRFIDMLIETGKTTDVIERALAFREGPGVTDDEYAELTYAAGRELIISGKFDEGMKLGIEAAKSRPSKLAYQYLETLGGDAALRGHMTARLEADHWLEKNSGPFGATERFLSNLAFVEEASGNLPRAIAVLERLENEHPASPGLGQQLLRLSVLYSQLGDEEKSNSVLARVRDGSHPDEIKAIAKKSLELDVGPEPGLTHSLPMGPALTWRFALLLLNGILVFVILMIIRARRQSPMARPSQDSALESSGQK